MGSFSITCTINSNTQELKLNTLLSDKLYCEFIFGALCLLKICGSFWIKFHCVPLKKLPPVRSDMISPYLLLALSDYKILNKKNLNGIRIDNLLNL